MPGEKSSNRSVLHYSPCQRGCENVGLRWPSELPRVNGIDVCLFDVGEIVWTWRVFDDPVGGVWWPSLVLQTVTQKQHFRLTDQYDVDDYIYANIVILFFGTSRCELLPVKAVVAGQEVMAVRPFCDNPLDTFNGSLPDVPCRVDYEMACTQAVACALTALNYQVRPDLSFIDCVTQTFCPCGYVRPVMQPDQFCRVIYDLNNDIALDDIGGHRSSQSPPFDLRRGVFCPVEVVLIRNQSLTVRATVQDIQ